MKYRWFLSIITLQSALLVALVTGSAITEPESPCDTRLVEALMLTDLSIWTEARYTRHPSQADFFSAFQDGLGAPDHFPAGAWVPVPEYTSKAGPAQNNGTIERENR
jgi:hypothetical protein